MKTEPNQPVYPRSSERAMEDRPSLTKRELFAAMAMQGLLANPHPQVQSLSHQDTAMVARDAADALISRLNESPK